ncbi:MAG: hypothetical protein KGL39_40290 [Patescibacteria group bacterium]|nr:hypothetical protein [Patescibacteria group bacterium]
MLTVECWSKVLNTCYPVSISEAAETLATEAPDPEIRVGRDAIIEMLLSGRTLQTQNHVYRRCRPEAATLDSVKAAGFKLGQRRQIFRDLVTVQDRLATYYSVPRIPESYAIVELKHGLNGPQLKAIEEEGLANDWPLDKNRDQPAPVPGVVENGATNGEEVA